MSESAIQNPKSKIQNPPRRQVYPRTLCFIQHGNDILMLQGAPTKRLYANLFNGIGGHVEAGEDVLSSLRREVREETGLEIENPYMRAVLNVDEAGKPGVVIGFFLATASMRRVIASEEGQLYWIPQERVYDFDLVEDLHQLLPRILEPEKTGIWYGYYGYDEQGVLVEIDWKMGISQK